MFSLPPRCSVATETENSNDMNVENNHTAETEKNGSETITIQTALGDEDDVHKCGRCQSEFSTLEAFIQHKLQNSCRRVEARNVGQDANQNISAANKGSSSEIKTNEGASPDKPERTTDDESGSLLGRGHRKKVASVKVSEQSDQSVGFASDGADGDRPPYKVNQEGRYICHLCEKTFKTTNILRTHMKTHSDQKNFSCELCSTSFRTKGSLIRHNRRHTDERPYRCTLCGQSFRESGALTRHLKALTPCTEKIRFVQYKEILVSKDGVQKGVDADRAAVTTQQEVVVVEQQPEEQEMVEAQTAVVSVVDAASQEVLRQVHFTVEVDGATQEQQVVVEQSQAEALAAAAAAGDNLICQAIINSGIALGTEETVVEEEDASQTTEQMNKVDSDQPDADQNIIEIQVKEEVAEMEEESGDDRASSKLYTCPYCNRSFKGLNYFRFHVKGHLGYKPFKCTLCQKEFLTGYLLKKHMEVHVSERRYKCGECGKLYKTIGHVREHMRAHSDERPYHCSRCNKGYKTKNALQVHQRTHFDDKPYVCEFCLRGFREKGSLVRHVRHHTGEKPFKCSKCGRGFAEHGTLNRHMRAKGGCQKDGSCEQQDGVAEEQTSVDGLTTADVISEDPHAVLVEFSSVVADTQEYIIKPGGSRVTNAVVRESPVLRHSSSLTDRLMTPPTLCGHPRGERQTGARGGKRASVTASPGRSGGREKAVRAAAAHGAAQTVVAASPGRGGKAKLFASSTQTEEEMQEEVTLIQEEQNEVGNQIMKVVQQIVSQSHGAGSHQIIVRNVAADEEGTSISDCGDTITIATPESLTEQVAMTLASAISDGTLLATAGTVEEAEGTVTMVTTEEAVEEGIQMVQQQEEYVITSPEEVEIQTVVL